MSSCLEYWPERGLTHTRSQPGCGPVPSGSVVGRYVNWPVTGGAPDLTPSSHAQMIAFERRVKRGGVEAVLRRSRGLDISAACGQLRVEVERRRKVLPEVHAGVDE